jgi:glucose-6-phosphate 1-epimerase
VTSPSTGLTGIRLAHASGASARVCLHGAHVTSWVPAGGAEALFVSRAAKFQAGTAIRGGIPVIFPQFAGFGPLPKHGFARTTPWRVVDGPAAEDAGARAVLGLEDDEGTRAVWPHAFRAQLAVEVVERTFRCALSIENTGDVPFAFTGALHTYLRVADVHRTSIGGLRGCTYADSLRGGETRVEEEAELRMPDEIDRIYRDTPRELRVMDEAGGRTFLVRAEGFADTVVWNPGARGAASLPDMEAGEEREMLCVEAAQVNRPVTLAPGERWQGAQSLQAI